MQFFLLLSTYKEIKRDINDCGAQYTVILKWTDLGAEKKKYSLFFKTKSAYLQL